MALPLSARAKELLDSARRETAFTDEREVRAWFEARALPIEETILRAQVELGGYSYPLDRSGRFTLGLSVNGDPWDADCVWEEEGQPLRVVFGEQEADPALYFLDANGRVTRGGDTTPLYTSVVKMIEDHAMSYWVWGERPFSFVRLRVKAPGALQVLEAFGLKKLPEASDERVMWFEGRGLYVNVHPHNLEDPDTLGVRLMGKKQEDVRALRERLGALLVK